MHLTNFQPAIAPPGPPGDWTLRPPPLPPPPSIDPTVAMLDTPAGTLLEGSAGDLCSLLGIVGASTIVFSHRLPAREALGERIVAGSMGAGAVDTSIQARNVLAGGSDAAEARGNERSTPGTVAYAATGLIPAASIVALRGLHPHPSRREVAAIGLLALNTGVLGYELVTRAPRIVRGEEDTSGYGSLLASLGGFVVARHLLHR